MKIKRIEITGFKSFLERTSLVFDEGVTSVVGPNGCGKSNIVDAIRWVMGEQSAKNLRGKAMEDVIFGGSENRKPLGMAEVNLVLDNNDGQAPAAFNEYSEIQVTRRLYRNGDSEYLLNKTPCRLLDVTELFMDTGVGNRAYSVIEQGKIGMIINAKPEERRSLIEEAAGVTKFKARKKSALRKIDATRQNLLRLSDIINEVRRQMNSLKRQAQKAKRYQEFREELKEIDLQFALREYTRLQEGVQLAGRSADSQTAHVEQLIGQVESYETDLEKARLLHAEKEKETSTGQEQVFRVTSEIQRIESELEFGAREIESLDRMQERVKVELSEIDQRLEAADSEEDELKKTQAELAGNVVAEKEQLSAVEKTLSELMAAELELNRQLEEARDRLYHLLTELSRMSSQQDEADRRLKALADLTERNHQEAVAVKGQLEMLQASSSSLNENLSAIRTDRDLLVGAREQHQDDLVRLRLQMDQTERHLLVRREELNRQRSRLESLQQLQRNLEGYGRGVKELLASPEHKDRIRSLVADILDVPAQYEAAVEVALGERVQALVPDSVDNVTEALAFLKEKESRCTFLLPDSAIASPPDIEGGKPLTDLLMSREGFHEPVARLLAGIYMVDDLQPFLKSELPFGVALVTATGQMLTSRGEITGGGRHAQDQGLLQKKREMKELAGQIRHLEKKVVDLNAQREGLRQAIIATEESLRESESSLHQHEIKVVDSEKDLVGLQQDEARLTERIEVLSLEEGQLHEEHEMLVRALQEASSGRTARETEKGEQEAAVARLQAEIQSIRVKSEEQTRGQTTLKVQLASVQEREENCRNSLARLETLREEFRGRKVLLGQDSIEAVEKQEALRVAADLAKKELESLFKQRVEKQAELNGLRDHFEESRQEIDRREAELKELRVRANKAREDLSDKQVQSRELVLETEHLRQAFLERYRLDLDDQETTGRFDAEFDMESAEGRREFLQKRVDDIGEVNLMAIEEFQELEERYTFLTVQQEDLQTSLEGLQAAIGKINRTTRKRFRETFDQVNDKFREVFPRLFNGGQAELRLTDENDLLETGVEVVAQPPGKKLQNVTLLSGGEKALTAVSLIFSIFLIKPSPFCLLDEVDAPLDDANIGRFNEMVAMMAQTSQFIIITHNKRTMEIADNLYGITMEEPGVSKLVSVRMGEVT